MPLNIPVGSAVLQTEYVCSECGNETYTSYDPAEIRYCAFCGEPKAFNNGSFKSYIKKEIDEKETTE